MDLAYIALFFVLGLALGSFFNVLVLRYNPAKSIFSLKIIGGRSRCPHCLTSLSFIELVPLLSFAFQKGKCLHCGGKISFFYPTVEFLTGVITAFTFYFVKSFYKLDYGKFFYNGDLSVYFLFVIWILIVLTLWLIVLFDLKYYLIPNELNLILALEGVVLSIFLNFFQDYFPFKTSFLENYAMIFNPFSSLLLNHLCGGLLGGLFFLLLVILSRGKGVGMGDVKLAFSSGLVFGFADILVSIILSFILGGFVGLFLLIFGGKTFKDKVPFAPIFVTGIFLVMFFGRGIMDIYFKLFGI